MATVNAIATEVMSEVGEDTSNATLVTQFENWVKATYEELGSAHKWRNLRGTQTLATVASTATYNLDAAAQDIIGMRIPSGDYPINYIEFKDLENLGVDLEMEGRPYYWYWSGAAVDVTDVDQKIGLWPVPDAIYSISIYYRSQPMGLLTSSHVPLPYEFLHVIKDGVRARYYYNEDDIPRGDRFFQFFQKGLMRLIFRYKNSEDSTARLSVSDIPDSSGSVRPVRFPPDHYSNW